MPAEAPVPVSVVPWPQERRGLRPAARRPPGSISAPRATKPSRGREAFGELVEGLFPVEGHRPPGRRGRVPGRAVARPRASAPEAYAIRFSRTERRGFGRHAHRPALRPDHARPDPARRPPSSRDLPVSGRRRNPRRAGARLARHPSRRRAAVLRARPRSSDSCASSPGTSSTASTGISPTTRPGASRSTPIRS